MERAFETNFSAVRVHEGPEARTIGAAAFTQGSDIFFKPGLFRPDRGTGQKLLAHELAHVEQQRRGVRPPGGIGRPNDRYERDADAAADRVAAGRSAGLMRNATPASRDSRVAIQMNRDAPKTSPDTGIPGIQDEIAAQYLEEDRISELKKHWADNGFLKTIRDKQSQNTRPRQSEALLHRLHTDRGGNPSSVSVHANIGSLEAALRGSANATTSTELNIGKRNRVTEKLEQFQSPYQGGHLVAFQFSGDAANIYDNVVPQGAQLNNSIFSPWEEGVLATAIKDTRQTLKTEGVADSKVPDLFRYSVWVSYPVGTYQTSPQTLESLGVVPGGHAAFIVNPVRLIKRIPESLTAVAVILALPSAEELGIERRPDTPFIFEEASDFGVIDTDFPNRGFVARAPTRLAENLKIRGIGPSPAAQLFLGFGANPKAKVRSFAIIDEMVGDLDNLTTPEEESKKVRKWESIWTGPNFFLPTGGGVSVDLEAVPNKLFSKNISREEFELLDSNWIGMGKDQVTLTPKDVLELIHFVATDGKEGQLPAVLESSKNRMQSAKNVLKDYLTGLGDILVNRRRVLESLGLADPAPSSSDSSDPQNFSLPRPGVLRPGQVTPGEPVKFVFKARETQPPG